MLTNVKNSYDVEFDITIGGSPGSTRIFTIVTWFRTLPDLKFGYIVTVDPLTGIILRHGIDSKPSDTETSEKLGPEKIDPEEIRPKTTNRISFTIFFKSLGVSSFIINAIVKQQLPVPTAGAAADSSGVNIANLVTSNNGIIRISCNNSDIEILIRATTDYFTGDNLAQSVFTIQDIMPHKRCECTDNIVEINSDKLIDKPRGVSIYQTSLENSSTLPTTKIHHGPLTRTTMYQTSYSRYPDLTPVVIGDECTLASKIITIRATSFPELNGYEVLAKLVLYAMLRYFLGFLLYGKFDINILLRRYTQKFFDDLAESRYSGFIEAFTTDLLAGMDVYFKP